MNKTIFLVFAIICYSAAFQSQDSYVNPQSAIVVKDESNAIRNVRSAEPEDIIYDKSLLKKIVKKLRNYINQVMETYDLDATKPDENSPKSHKESNSSDDKESHKESNASDDKESQNSNNDSDLKKHSKNYHHSSHTDEENVANSDDEHHKTISDAEKDNKDENLSEKCAHYQKIHNHKANSKSNDDDSTKDEPAFMDNYSERFLRNIPYDRNYNEDNTQ